MNRVVNRVFALLLLFGATSAQAVWSTNSWTTDGSSYSGNYNDPTHFSPAVPGKTDVVLFTNRQATAYTVTFQKNVTNGVMHVGTDKVTYDMNGRFWWQLPDAGAPGVWYGGYAVPSCQAIAAEAGEVATVTLSSSSPGTNTVAWDGYTRCGWIGNASGSATLNINTSLGYGARLWMALSPYLRNITHATINVQGAGAVLQDDATYGQAHSSTLNVTAGGKVDNSLGGNTQFFSGGGGNTVNVSNAGIVLTKDILISYFSPGGVWKITSGGTWNARDVDMAYLTVYPNHGVLPWDGQLLIDGAASSVTLRSLRIGNPSAGYYANARVIVTNGATLTTTNNILVNAYTISPTNTLILNGAKIRLGRGATAGSLVNQAIMWVTSGTITGIGSAPCGVQNEKTLAIGSGISGLAMNNAHLTNTAAGRLTFEFDATSCDTIAITNGTATIAGTCVFTNLPSFTPVLKQCYGKTWDFVRADDIAYTASDNVTSLMTSFGMVQNVDYTFGVVSVGARKALRLYIIQPPRGTMVVVR